MAPISRDSERKYSPVSVNSRNLSRTPMQTSCGVAFDSTSVHFWPSCARQETEKIVTRATTFKEIRRSTLPRKHFLENTLRKHRNLGLACFVAAPNRKFPGFLFIWNSRRSIDCRSAEIGRRFHLIIIHAARPRAHLHRNKSIARVRIAHRQTPLPHRQFLRQASNS